MSCFRYKSALILLYLVCGLLLIILFIFCGRLKRVLFGKSRPQFRKEPIEIITEAEQDDLYVERLRVENMKLRFKWQLDISALVIYGLLLAQVLKDWGRSCV